MFFKEILLCLSDFVFVEEAIKDFLRVSGLVSGDNHVSLDWSNLSELNSWRSQESTGEEERIIEIKEMSKESSAHC